jgi:hypothetical protein
MITISSFLIGSIYCLYKFNPRTKSKLWKYTILFPLIFVFISFFSSQSEILGHAGYPRYSNAYGLGVWSRRVIGPFVISILFLYYFYSKKMENNGINKKFNIILIIIGLMAFLLLYQGLLSKYESEERHKVFEEYLEKNKALDEIKSSLIIIKENLPITSPDGYIIYDIVLDEKKQQVIYLYKDNTSSIEDLNYNDIIEYKNSWREDLINKSKNNPKNVSFVKANISMVFKLEDINGMPILDVTIRPEDMK